MTQAARHPHARRRQRRIDPVAWTIMPGRATSPSTASPAGRAVREWSSAQMWARVRYILLR
eukprot:scaffold45542_cov63-Phaeocystis_antarctica.AAC.2